MIAMLLLAAANLPSDFDAVAAAPASHHILLDTDKVRVLRVVVEPGQTEPVHEHRCPSIMYFEQPQPITYIEYALEEDVPVAVRRVDAPALEATQTVSAAPEGLHAIRNRGSARFVAIRVEFKEDGCLPPHAAKSP